MATEPPGVATVLTGALHHVKPKHVKVSVHPYTYANLGPLALFAADADTLLAVGEEIVRQVRLAKATNRAAWRAAPPEAWDEAVAKFRAEPEPEPVAWRVVDKDGDDGGALFDTEAEAEEARREWDKQYPELASHRAEALYAAPPKAADR